MDMAAKTAQSSTSQSRTVCIVLAPLDVERDGAIQRAIEQRGWHPLMISDPLAAMIEAAVREREQIARSQWGLIRHESIVMVVSEQWASERPSECEQLLRAMSRYLPGVALWSHHGDRITPRRARKSSANESTAPAKQSAPPRPQASCRSAAHDSDAEVTVTREEMDMLLETAGGGER